ncbi:MAG: hypothetical protein ACFFEJ_17460 [Candidatus Thorarchaeota archaeon]
MKTYDATRGVDTLVTAIENLYSVGIGAIIFFLVSLALVFVIKRVDTSPTLRVVRRKPLIVPALIFLLAVVMVPRERIGPPPDMLFNYVTHDFATSYSTDFSLYDIEPYLARARVTYTYQMEIDEIIRFNVLVYQGTTVVANITTNMYRTSEYQLETVHSTFELPYGNYTLRFSQTVLNLDGYPTLRHRYVHLIFEQVQNLQWVDESILWDQCILFLIFSGLSLLFIGIYLTDHTEDNEVERERYERKKRGERNYSYWRADRRRTKNRQWAERMRDKR